MTIERAATGASVRSEILGTVLGGGVRSSAAVMGEGIGCRPAALDRAGLVVVRPLGAPHVGAEVTR